MAALRGKAWTLQKAFEGIPKLSDFKLIEETLPSALKNGEILVEALYLSVDPYMRLFPAKVGSVMIGEQVARVKESKNSQYPVGSLVQFYHGWRTRAVISPTMTDVQSPTGSLMLQRLPDLGQLSPSLALGVMGMPGLTAYFALEDRGEPIKPGETVMISGAAGAVGSVAGQIAKIKGAKVIGSAGTEEKCKLLKKWGFDHVFNYKTTKVQDALQSFAPDGVDLYFDNVGGDFSWEVYQHMKLKGRVIVVGSISTYNDPKHGGQNLFETMLMKMLSFHGMMIWKYVDRFPEGVAKLLRWIREGRIKYTDSIVEGFDKMPEAFISLFKGTSTGKVVVKV